jgi:hypothetical protein
MKRYALASVLLVTLATPAFAAEHQATGHQATQHFAVVDTVGNCSVIDTKPSAYDVSGLKILGDKSGYSSPDAAMKALKSGGAECKGTIDRA